MPNTIIATQLAVDPALVMDANYKFNAAQRRVIDDQIRAIEQLIVDNLINGKHASWFDLSGASSAVVAGDTVCLAGVPGLVTKCTEIDLAAAHSAIGVVVQASSPGSKVLVALSGVISSVITGLGASANGYVRVNQATSRCEKVDGISVGDIILGTVDDGGWMHIMPAPTLGGQVTYGGDFGRILSIPGTLTTHDDSQTPGPVFNMTAETLCAFDVMVTAVSATTATIGGRWKRSAVYNFTSGVSAIIGSVEVGTDEETDPGLDVTIDTDGSGAIAVLVTGLVATDINWLVELRVQESSSL